MIFIQNNVMPIPNPTPNEDKFVFLSRCMSDEKMQTEFSDTDQRMAVCLSKTQSSFYVLDQLEYSILAKNSFWDEEWQELCWETTASEIFDETGVSLGAEYQGKKVTLNKPFRTPDGPKKFGVYVKNDKGNIVLVRFGDPNLSIKRDDPKRRKSFRARHKCDSDPGPKWKARYWSCYQWRANSPVKD